ncbi:MAG: ATP-binding cassette domain-containing protein [Spirochaetales bacterium]|nr:ATP-binding cassette domain-containing protein [Spirochaetales bacterium]
MILVENLRKTFKVREKTGGKTGFSLKRKTRKVHALDGVSFSINKGELVGYIGPNGAGKSTTVKILSGILVPDSGTCVVDGLVPWKKRIAHVRKIGVVFGQRTQLFWDLPVIDTFDLLGEIYRLDKMEYKRTKDRLIAAFGIEKLLPVPVRQLSLGQRMKCELACSLVHEPSILFLDEPTIGLDAVSKLTVRDLIRKTNRESGTTVILTTHDLDDIEALCPRILIIQEGRILFDGAIENLRRKISGERRLIIDLKDSKDRITDSFVTVIEQNGPRVHLSFDPAKIHPADLIKRIIENHPVMDIFVENPPIEEIIARFYATL